MLSVGLEPTVCFRKLLLAHVQLPGLHKENNTSLSKKNVMYYSQGEMLPLGTKQSRGKLLPHSDLQGGVFLEEASRRRQRKRDILLGMWNVRSLHSAGSLTAAASELARYKSDLVGV